MGSLLDRARKRRKTVAVAIPELDATVYVKTMGAKEALQSSSLYRKAAEGDADAMTKAYRLLLLNCVFDESGASEFTAETVDEFLEVAPFEMVNSIVSAVQATIGDELKEEIEDKGKAIAENETSS